MSNEQAAQPGAALPAAGTPMQKGVAAHGKKGGYASVPTPLKDSNNPQMDGVELLVELAKRGEIDPWNVDIVTVADQYLKAVSELKESDLKITGKTLLYLAVLLRMKSDQLAGINYLNPPEDEFMDELEPDFMDDGRAVQPKFSFKSLDEVIQRRTSTKQPRIRNVTLNDLIRELQKYEEMEKRRSLREKVETASKRRTGMRDYADFTADDIEEMAHEEFLEDTILRLKYILEKVLVHNENVTLTELIEEGGIDKISAFLALLFLEARGEVQMQQEEFYSEIYITPDTPRAPGSQIVIEMLDDAPEEPERKPRKRKPKAVTVEEAAESDDDENQLLIPSGTDEAEASDDSDEEDDDLESDDDDDEDYDEDDDFDDEDDDSDDEDDFDEDEVEEAVDDTRPTATIIVDEPDADDNVDELAG